VIGFILDGRKRRPKGQNLFLSGRHGVHLLPQNGAYGGLLYTPMHKKRLTLNQ